MAQPAPKLSVIMPVHNAARTLPQALDSVLSQSLEDLELICVDDGSTDESLSVLEDCAAKDGRVRVFSQENLHAGPARNRGLEAARGEYVHFLDADDFALPFAYEVLCSKADKHDLDALFCAAVDWDESEQSFVAKRRDNLLLLGPDDFGRLVGLEEGSPIYRVCVAPWAALYRRSFLVDHDIRFGDLFCVNDRAFFDAAITNAGRMMVCRDRAVCHRVNQEGSLVDARAAHFDCHFRSIEQIVGRMHRDGVDLKVQERILREEFNDLFYWFGLLADGSELGGSIVRQTADFVAGYKGPFAHVLKGKHLDATKRLSSSKGAGRQEYAKVEMRRSACAAPKVSVVLPVGDAGEQLNEALESLSKQTLREMEFLCVDCGGTDGSMAVVREYAALDGRFRVLEGGGAGAGESAATADVPWGFGAAVNRGIDEARGEYLGVLDPNDVPPKDMYAGLFKLAERHGLDFVKAEVHDLGLRPDGSQRGRSSHPVEDRGCFDRVIRPADELPSFKFATGAEGGIYRLSFLKGWGIRWSEAGLEGADGVDAAGAVDGGVGNVAARSWDPSRWDTLFCFQVFCCAERALLVDSSSCLVRRGVSGQGTTEGDLAVGKGPLLDERVMDLVDGEFSRMGEWLAQDPELAQKVEPTLGAAKAAALLSVCRRAAPQSQLACLRRTGDEFAEPLSQGRIDEALIDPCDLVQLREIAADPDAYGSRVCVSVVMPVYNAEAYLDQALDGLLARNDLPIEVICVDDGSTDGSLDVLWAFAARDPRVRVVSQPNSGAGAARNAGMRLARGKYLSFVDSDDLFEPDMLSRAYVRARETDADVVVFRCDEYHEGTRTFAPTDWTINHDLLPAEEPFAASEVPCNLFKAFVGWPWDKLFRTDYIRSLGLRFQGLRTSNDLLFVYSALAKADRIATLDEVLAHRRMHAGSLSTTREFSWDCCHDALCALRRQLVDWGLFQEREQDFVNYCLNFTLWHLNSLEGEAYCGFYDKLKNEWLDELGVTGRSMDYFYKRDEYLQLEKLLASTSEEFLFWQLGRARNARDEVALKLGSVRGRLDEQKRQGAEQAERLLRLSDRLTARIDIKNNGDAANRVDVLDVSDCDALVVAPEWLVDENGAGQHIVSTAGSLEARLACVGDGELVIALKSRNSAGGGASAGARGWDGIEDGLEGPAEVWVDYTDVRVDGEPAFAGTRSASADHPCRIRREVKDGQVVELSLSWHSHDERGLAAEEEALKAEGEHLRSSTTWKAGRVLTWLPRKVKRAVKGKNKS